MQFMRTFAGIGLIAALTACTVPGVSSRTASFEGDAAGPTARFATDAIRVSDINVIVPETLTVSEENRMFPREDIVWRGDPRGNRYEQVKSIIETAFSRGSQAFSGPRAVVLDVEVVRFHALTERARYSIGGTHDVDFFLTVRDARTGEVLQARRFIDSNLKAFGGDEALQAEAEGETQKKRVTDHLARVIQGELSGVDIPEVTTALNFR